jgi:hypothetical protein
MLRRALLVLLLGVVAAAFGMGAKTTEPSAPSAAGLDSIGLRDVVDDHGRGDGANTGRIERPTSAARLGTARPASQPVAGRARGDDDDDRRAGSDDGRASRSDDDLALDDDGGSRRANLTPAQTAPTGGDDDDVCCAGDDDAAGEDDGGGDDGGGDD